MSEVVAKYSGGRLSHFEYPGLLDAPAMCTATVDLAADWTQSIAIPSPLQAFLPQICAQTVLTAFRWEGAEREGIKESACFCSPLVAEPQLVSPKQVGVGGGGGKPALLSIFAGLGRRMLKGYGGRGWE